MNTTWYCTASYIKPLRKAEHKSKPGTAVLLARRPSRTRKCTLPPPQILLRVYSSTDNSENTARNVAAAVPAASHLEAALIRGGRSRGRRAAGAPPPGTAVDTGATSTTATTTPHPPPPTSTHQLPQHRHQYQRQQLFIPSNLPTSSPSPLLGARACVRACAGTQPRLPSKKNIKQNSAKRRENTKNDELTIKTLNYKKKVPGVFVFYLPGYVSLHENMKNEHFGKTTKKKKKIKTREKKNKKKKKRSNKQQATRRSYPRETKETQQTKLHCGQKMLPNTYATSV